LGLAVLIGGAFLVRRRHPLASFGILWFFVMQLLVSTIFPLELVFEHRNYMGSMGIFLALLSLLFVGQGGERLHWARRALVAGLIASYGVLTLVRAQEWGDPLRLAFAEAERHPRSVRANYELGKALYAIAPDPSSLPFSKATESMERAWQLPRTSLLPAQALLLMHAKYGLPFEDAWWAGMRKYIATRPLAAQDINALYSLIAARIAGVSELPDAELGLVLKEAYDQNPGRYLLATLYANYLLNVRGDPERAETMLQRAVALAPKNPQMWINLIQLQLATGQLDAAQTGLSRLAELDRLGTLGPEIDRLRRLADKQKARAPASPSPPRS
jgi:tetratricopeptide (TPR) repeat protein